MPQVNTPQNIDRQIVAQDVLRLLAADSASPQTISAILGIVQKVSGAKSAEFVLFNDPRLTIQVGKNDSWSGKEVALQSFASGLSNGFNPNPALPAELKTQDSASAIAPLHVNGKLVGALWLSFDSAAAELDVSEQEVLTLVVDALKILAANLQTRESHDRSQQLTTSLLNSITDPLLVLDDSRHLLLLNPAAETVFETTSTAAQGRPLKDVVHSDDLTAFVEEDKALSEWMAAEKTFVPRIVAVRDSDGNLEGWVLALRDVTQFKKLNRNQSEFMRIVSHDLRSPLTSMQGFASMLELGLVGELNEKQKHFATKILSGISQMTALVDNIQDAGRYDPETGFYELTRSHCDLGEMVRRIVDNQLVPAEKTLGISVSVADDVPIINADANMLERAIINLVDNAIKYTPTDGKIEVSVRKDDNDVVVMVKDTGLGISKEDQKHLFERHVRVARQEHKKIKGSGLGLFIVRSVAQRHGGDAWVESQEGKGSTFYLGIPLEGPNLIAPKN